LVLSLLQFILLLKPDTYPYNATEQQIMENLASDKYERNRKKKYNWTSVSSGSLTPRQELTLLAKTNTGLCRYIESVRQITGENRKLVTVVETLEESRVKENDDIEQLYKDKVDDLKKEKEKIEKDVRKLLNETDVLRMLNNELKYKNETSKEREKLQEVTKATLISEKRTLKENIVKNQSEIELMKSLLESSLQKTKTIEVSISEVQEKANDVKHQNENLIKERILKKNLTEDKDSKMMTTEEIVREMKEEKLNPLARKMLKDLYKILDQKEKFTLENDKLDESLEKLSKQKENEFYILSQIEENQNESARLSKLIEDLVREEDQLKMKIDQIKDTSDKISKAHEDILNTKDEKIHDIHEKLKDMELKLEELYLVKQGLDAEIKVYKTLVETTEDTYAEKVDQSLQDHQNNISENEVLSESIIESKLQTPKFSFVSQPQPLKEQLVIDATEAR